MNICAQAHRAKPDRWPILEPSTILAKGTKIGYCSLMDKTNAIRDYFTETEWDALFDAICEYQDHGEDESEMSAQIQSKITKLFA